MAIFTVNSSNSQFLPETQAVVWQPGYRQRIDGTTYQVGGFYKDGFWQSVEREVQAAPQPEERAKLYKKVEVESLSYSAAISITPETELQKKLIAAILKRGKSYISIMFFHLPRAEVNTIMGRSEESNY